MLKLTFLVQLFFIMKITLMNRMKFMRPKTSNKGRGQVRSFFNWNSLHSRLNSRYKAQSYKKTNKKNMKRT